MRGLFALITLSLSVASSGVLASSSCIAFDTEWNLLSFGFHGRDFNASTSDTWARGNATDITTAGRPPFNGANTECYLAALVNAIYVFGADVSKPSDVYIYDATAKRWSAQTTSVGTLDLSSFEAILDHDTNVFYALSQGEVYSLFLGSLTTAQSNPIPWENIQAAPPNIAARSYDPIMANANNFIYFFGVPNTPAGEAPIYMIHFSFFPPDPVQFEGGFPDVRGKATSFFVDGTFQQQIAFIPDDGSHTFIIDVKANVTQIMAGPSIIDSAATYFASTGALVQLSSSGNVSWLPFSPSNASANSAAMWMPVQSLADLVVGVL
ncbi:hypothetical protein MVEN_01586400 [Mycena venus]|uniref:Uncharacterized protein n=1 Tax=Mycena venus TaxID=2733690 RepID=A0A8H6XSJ8_9AGAR|nr:hypothetical protein MVEN_01586400 [Mycena venus]